jgi:hypothetical protein
MDALELFFGKKRRARKTKRSPGRRPKRGLRKLPKSKAYVTVKGRKRKLYRGHNGGLYYRTKSGRAYVSPAVLKRRRHMLSPKRRRVRRAVKKLRRRRRRKLKMTKKAIAARRAYRKRMRRRGRFGEY